MADHNKLIEQTKATRFGKGESGNPGGRRKLKRELVLMARDHVPKAIERARQILDDDDAEWRAWMDAAKFVTAYGIGAPPKSETAKDDRPADPSEELEVDELRALARQALADDAAETDDAGDDSDETEH